MHACSDDSVIDIRCPEGRLHCKLINGNVIEVKCRHRNPAGRDFVVLHRYSLADLKQGRTEPIETLEFKDPVFRGRGALSHRKEVP